MKFLQTLFIFFLVSVAQASTLIWDRTEARVAMKPEQAVAKAEYTLTNNSDALRISKVSSSCGCTGTVIGKRILNPGESTEITAKFSKGKRTGTNHNKLAVYIDEQSKPVATLHFIVDIPELIRTTPQIVYWNSKTSKTPRTIEVSLNDQYIDKLDSIEFDAALVSVERVVSQDNASHFQLIVEPVDYSQPLRHSIEIKCQSKSGDPVSSKVHAFAHP